ncbi:PLP-dependent aminotransferase family protein, partial [Vibrio alginolyticus]
DIVVTSGALEALNLSLQAVTQPGDTVVVESPTFYGALQAIERLGLKAIEITVDPLTGHSVDHIEATFADNDVRACWLMTNFHNPTGTLLSDGQKQRIVEMADKYDVYLIEDDVYSELYFSEKKPSSLKAFDTQERVLHCGSFSKSLCPGYRLGWVVNKRFNAQLQKLQLISTLSGSAPIQQGIAHYLQNDSYDSHLRKLRKNLEQRQLAFIE